MRGGDSSGYLFSQNAALTLCKIHGPHRREQSYSATSKPKMKMYVSGRSGRNSISQPHQASRPVRGPGTVISNTPHTCVFLTLDNEVTLPWSLGRCSHFRVCRLGDHLPPLTDPNFPPGRSLLPPTRLHSVPQALESPSSVTFCSEHFFTLAIKTWNYFFFNLKFIFSLLL